MGEANSPAAAPVFSGIAVQNLLSQGLNTPENVWFGVWAEDL